MRFSRIDGRRGLPYCLKDDNQSGMWRESRVPGRRSQFSFPDDKPGGGVRPGLFFLRGLCPTSACGLSR
jgi:hypothetical protein